ncbi:MAG: hypothetical protein ABR899_00465 [Candidatus Krumholzibacteriaceae bacterium]|jgi:hypothetical protein
MQFSDIKNNWACWPAAALLLILSLAATVTDARADECSTAIITSAATVDARPILWKNRDTDHLSNMVVFVNDAPYSYLGIVDADDPSGRRVWVGLNAAGFAIMNTVAYNLPKKAGEAEDLEGVIMADALRLCKTVDDFESYIKRNTGRALGSQANFGVIDAAGGAADFEVHNNGYKRLNVADEPQKYLLVTNFARSGEAGKGRGLVRFDRLTELFRAKTDAKYSVTDVLETFARDTRNPILANPGPAKKEKLPAGKPYYIYTQQTIDRASTAAAVVLQDVVPGKDPKDATMWVILGEPVTGIAVPLWVEAGEVPPELFGEGAAPINQECMRLKTLMRPWKDDERVDYLDLTKLDNGAGGGWLALLVKKEQDIVKRTEAFLATNPGKAEKAAFQRQIASEVLQTLKGIQ